MIRQLSSIGTLSLILAATASGTTIFSSSPSIPTYEVANAIDTGGSQFSTDYAASGTGTATFINFDLGSLVNLASIQYTNRTSSGGANGSLTFGVNDFVTQYEYFFFTDNTFTTQIGNSGVLNFAVPGTANLASFQQTFTLPVFLPVEFVQFQVLAVNNNGVNPGGADFQFNAASAVPEPSTTALIGIGLVLLSVAMRNRTGISRLRP